MRQRTEIQALLSAVIAVATSAQSRAGLAKVFDEPEADAPEVGSIVRPKADLLMVRNEPVPDGCQAG